RSTRAARMSKARLPSRTGVSPSSRRRCAARSRNGPNAKVCSPPAVADGSVVAGIAQFAQQLSCRDQIAGAETLREAVVDRLKAGDGVGWSSLISQKPGEARRSAQLPSQHQL